MSPLHSSTSNHSDSPGDLDLLERALRFGVGVLPIQETEDFENHLIAGDPSYQRAWEVALPLVSHLIPETPSMSPRLISRSNLINALQLPKPAPSFAAKPDKNVLRESKPEHGEGASPDQGSEDLFQPDNSADMILVRAEQTRWEDTPIPGVQARSLWVDEVSNRATIMLKLAPGTVYPDHDHPGVEECLVIEGDLELGGKIMRKGDYMRIPAGGQHGTPRTTNGCLLLVTTALVSAA
jgi:quercetin dioxygenase-like cupin family protein